MLLLVIGVVLVLVMPMPHNERVLALEPSRGFQTAATERLAPDGETFTLTQLTGAYTDVDEDPDSHDNNYLNATGNNVNTAVLASFPTPTGNPTVGADLQEFRVRVHQFDEGQTGTPQARIELWENGVLVRAGTDTDVTTGGVVLSFTWNANELATADGSQVECNVVGTKSGGSPSARNSVEVDAIEWNVDYTAGGTAYDAFIYDSMTFDETASFVESFLQNVYDSITVDDTASFVESFVQNIFESIGVVGTTSLIVSFVQGLFESIAFAGTLSSSILILTFLFDSFVVSGTANIAMGYTVLLFGAIVANETLNIAAAFELGIYESFVVVGDPFAQKITQLFKNIYDSFPIVEAFVVVFSSLAGSMFFQLFFSLNMWGYLGPIGLVILGYIVANKEKSLGIIWFLVECLVLANYLVLVSATPDYWWHIYILLFGLFLCVYPLWEG